MKSLLAYTICKLVVIIDSKMSLHIISTHLMSYFLLSPSPLLFNAPQCGRNRTSIPWQHVYTPLHTSVHRLFKCRAGLEEV